MYAVVEVTADAATSVAGMPLLARTVLSLWSAGITRFTLLNVNGGTTDQHDAAIKEIQRVAPDARLTWVAPGASDPNALAGVTVIKAPTSGIYRSGFFADIIKQPTLDNTFLAFPGDAKAGVWILSAEAYQQLASGNEPQAEQIPVTTNAYVPASSDDQVDTAERMLFRWCTKATDGIVSRNLNRPISNWISRRLAHGDIRPMQLTAVTGLSALTMFLALIAGTPASIAAGCVLYHVTSVLDGLDGEIARAKYMSTPRGAAWDTAIDMATNLLFIIGISIGAEAAYDPVYGWLGCYIAVTAGVAILTMALALHFGPGGGSFDVLQMTIGRRLRANPRLAKTFSIVNVVFKRDLFAFLFAMLGLAGFATVIPWLLSVGVTVWLIAIIVNVPTLLSSRREDVLPPHLLRAGGNPTSD